VSSATDPRVAERPDPATPPEPTERRYRLPAALLLIGLLLAIPIAGGLLLLDLIQVRSSLQTAREGLSIVGRSLGDGDLDTAVSTLEFADGKLAEARDRTDGPLWSLAAVTPVVRHPIDLTREIVEVGSAAVDLGLQAATEGGELLADGGLDVVVRDGRIDLEPIVGAQALAASLPVDRLVVARDELAAPRTGWVPGVLRDARTDTLALADGVVDTATRARSLTAALPGFLGADGPRRYFVGMQTSAELRGTGGLIGFWGVLGVDDGRVVFGDSEVYESFDEVDGPPEESGIERVGSLLGPIEEGADADPAYLERYARVAGHSFFSNINLDPDLPTTADVALDLYELRTGERLDGMILLDPLGLERLLAATGSELPVPPELSASLGLEETMPTDRFASLVTIDIYETLGAGRSAERKEALRTIGDAAIARVLGGGWEGVEMASAIVDASAERHLQVFSRADDEQAAFVDVGAGGALAPSPTADLLAVTANNAVGGKQDVHLGHRFDVAVTLDDVRRGDDGALSVGRAMSVEVGVDNPLPSSGMDEYVIGNCVRDDGEVRCFEGPPGVNVTWFSAWFPTGTEVVGARTDAGDQVSGVGTFRDLTVVDQFQTTPSAGSSSFVLEAAGRAPVRFGAETLVYELAWWRQSKAIPDLLDVVVSAPSGWRVVDVEVAGGGSGRGMGVHGDGVPLTAEVTGGGAGARLHGTVTADTRLLVHLVGVGD
jgi:hypothetical protein